MYFLYIFFVIMLFSLYKFHSFIRDTYYEHNQIYIISDNYKKKIKDPYY